MTLEQIFLSAIGAVTTALCFLFNIIRLRSEACEKWRAEKEPIIAEMAKQLGIAEGVATFVNACKTKGCPFAGKLDTSVSLSPKPPKEKP
jgi:hypothetical protein